MGFEAMLRRLFGDLFATAGPPWGVVSLLQNVSCGLYLILIVYTFIRCGLEYRCNLIPLGGLALYFLCLPLYLSFTTIVLVVSLVRVFTGHTGEWVVTRRGYTKLTTAPAEKAAEPMRALVFC